MNAAHSHLLINHFPIIGLVLAIAILLIGILVKSSVTRRVGLLLFFIAGVTALPAFSTGEGAEEVIEAKVEAGCEKGCVCDPTLMQAKEKEMHHLIHEHEEKAEELMPMMWGIIVLSAIALFLEFKKKSMATIASIIVLIIGVVAIYFAREVGNSGGEISHPEIRKEFKIGTSSEQDED